MGMAIFTIDIHTFVRFQFNLHNRINVHTRQLKCAQCACMITMVAMRMHDYYGETKLNDTIH